MDSDKGETLRPDPLEKGGENDPLGGAATNPYSQADAKHPRAAVRYHEGDKATTSERDEMYDEDSLNPPGSVGESGSQGDLAGREDQNPIGRRNA